MKDLFEAPVEVYYYPECDNLVLINPPTLYMLATMQGSNDRKLCVDKEEAIKKYSLVFIGEL